MDHLQQKKEQADLKRELLILFLQVTILSVLFYISSSDSLWLIAGASTFFIFVIVKLYSSSQQTGRKG